MLTKTDAIRVTVVLLFASLGVAMGALLLMCCELHNPVPVDPTYPPEPPLARDAGADR